MSQERIAQLLQFLNQNPTDEFVQFALALEYKKKNETSTALFYFTQLLRQNPNYTATYYHLGKLYETQNQDDLAKQTYQTGIAICKTKGEQHAQSELQAALLELEYKDLY